MNCAVLLKTSIVENNKAPPYIFLNSDKVSVGRHGDVRIDTPGGKEISKIHCYFIKRVQINSAVWIIEDNHSTNGTFVNLRKAQRQLLQNGDEVVFGGGGGFRIGERIESSDLSTCRYRFFFLDFPVKFGKLDPNKEVSPDSEEEMCPICYSPMVSPETLPCGHRFCLHCIYGWAVTCAHSYRPAVCPMCRAPFVHSQLTPHEAYIKNGELRICSVDGILRELNVSSCKMVRGVNIFKKWTENRKRWFWKAYNLMKNNIYRRTIFLFLTKATFGAILKEDEKGLATALRNFEMDPSGLSRDQMIRNLTMFIVTTLAPQPPGAVVVYRRCQ